MTNYNRIIHLSYYLLIVWVRRQSPWNKLIQLFTKKMLKLACLLLTTCLLISPAWTCPPSTSEEDKNFLIEDPVQGSDYNDYDQSAIDHVSGTDPDIICRIEVLTTNGFRKRCVSKMHYNIQKSIVILKAIEKTHFISVPNVPSPFPIGELSLKLSKFSAIAVGN